MAWTGAVRNRQQTRMFPASRRTVAQFGRMAERYVAGHRGCSRRQYDDGRQQESQRDPSDSSECALRPDYFASPACDR